MATGNNSQWRDTQKANDAEDIGFNLNQSHQSMKVDNNTDSKDRTPDPVSTVLTSDDDIDLTQSQSQSLISDEVPNTRKNKKDSNYTCNETQKASAIDDT
ncbi:hypothetical protein DPMN_163850 [Dreissena polymorpha]|uniref:Uncharacterized protein n=1 Tax=Dreissena polymorpha TaxID=45954 RepID=A0A9D4ET00_DREPO|nr:hypothetical protein DPMN_163850 [Dreissena polymorpha]